jgi:hypothetical protein
MVVTESGKFSAEYYYPFTMLQQNLGCDESKDAYKVEKNVS